MQCAKYVFLETCLVVLSKSFTLVIFIFQKDKTHSKGGSAARRSIESNLVNCIGGTNGCGKYEQYGYTHTVCCCTSNLCNGVSAVRQQPLFLFVTIGTLTMLAYRWL